jgi:hypothetical protein
LKSGRLNLLEPSGPVQAYNGIYLFTHRTVGKAAICFSHGLKNLVFVTKPATSINSSPFTFY